MFIFSTIGAEITSAPQIYIFFTFKNSIYNIDTEIVSYLPQIISKKSPCIDHTVPLKNQVFLMRFVKRHYTFFQLKLYWLKGLNDLPENEFFSIRKKNFLEAFFPIFMEQGKIYLINSFSSKEKENLYIMCYNVIQSKTSGVIFLFLSKYILCIFIFDRLLFFPYTIFSHFFIIIFVVLSKWQENLFKINYNITYFIIVLRIHFGRRADFPFFFSLFDGM